MISYACVVNSNEHFFSNQKVSRILVLSFFFDGEIICSLFFFLVYYFIFTLACCVCPSVHICAGSSQHTEVWDNLKKLVLIYHHVGSGDGNQFTKLAEYHARSTGFNPQCFINWLCWQIPVTSALRRWRLSIQGHPQNLRSSWAYTEFEASLEYWKTLGERGWYLSCHRKEELGKCISAYRLLCRDACRKE